jgi:hypothetical protein
MLVIGQRAFVVYPMTSMQREAYGGAVDEVDYRGAVGGYADVAYAAQRNTQERQTRDLQRRQKAAYFRNNNRELTAADRTAAEKAINNIQF